VLLAAGESSRMGELKGLLPWCGQPLIAYQAAQLLAANVERVVVVLGHRAGDLRPHLPHDVRLAVVENEAYATGKVGSILVGMATVPEEHHVLILGVDQPRPAAVVAYTVEAHLATGASITVAGHRGRRGHPVVFAPWLRGELRGIDEPTQGLRAVLQRHAREVRLIETGSPLALVNLNTREDYTAALRLLESSAALPP
jgi:molybdenum cofactor cytidylyltransferase